MGLRLQISSPGALWKPLYSLQLQTYELATRDSTKSTIHCSKISQHEKECLPRRQLLLTASALFLLIPLPAFARQRKKTVPIDQYNTSSDGLKYYDVVEGKGPEATKGSAVLVHFDCKFKGLTVVSSRESKLLAGNRVIAEPYEFIVGAPPGRERKRDFTDNANGLFSAQAAPKPPKALYSITEGMKVGGQRTVIVTPELGYGKKGMAEIPPNGTFELNIELLEVRPPTSPN